MGELEMTETARHKEGIEGKGGQKAVEKVEKAHGAKKAKQQQQQRHHQNHLPTKNITMLHTNRRPGLKVMLIPSKYSRTKRNGLQTSFKPINFLWRVMSISTSHSKMAEERGEGKEVHGNHWIKKHKDHIASSSWLKIKERQDWRLSSGITPLTIIRTSTQEVIFENDIIESYRKARAEKNVRDLF